MGRRSPSRLPECPARAGPPAGGLNVREAIGTVRIRLTPAAGSGPIFVGIAPTQDLSGYLSGVERTVVRDPGNARGPRTYEGGAFDPTGGAAVLGRLQRGDGAAHHHLAGSVRVVVAGGIHLTVYLVINAGLVLIWALTWRGFFWPLFPMFGWGIGLGFHAWDTYRRPQPTEERIGREMRRLSRRGAA